MLDNMKCCDVLASRHWPFNNRMPHVWLHSSGLVSWCCSAVELSHHQRLLYCCLGQTSNSTKTKLDAQIWKRFVVAFQKKQCAHCFRCFTFNVLFSYASACRAEARSTAPVRSPASATRLTTSLWLPWSPWTPCLRPTRQRVSPAAPGFVLACPWCDRQTRQRTALLVWCELVF